MKPGQDSMTMATEEGRGEPNREKDKGSGAVQASTVATAGYLGVVVGHAALLWLHSQETSSTGHFFYFLVAVEVALAFEGFVYAAGGIFGRSRGKVLGLLMTAGRLQKLSQAMAWPWLLPWLAELGCRSGATEVAFGVTFWHTSVAIGGCLSAFYALSEASFVVLGEPASALDPNAVSNVGDCLPSQAVLGGHFKLDREALEVTGRALYVPARERNGLYIGAGLSLLSHLVGGLLLSKHIGAPTWLLLGAFAGMVGRRCGALFDNSKSSLWRVEGGRLFCRIGELIWIGCCVMEIRSAETRASWLSSCE